jgi:hypothetical protein
MAQHRLVPYGNMNRAQSAIWRNEISGAYVLAEVVAVHARKCKYWRMGKSHGPCTCGASLAIERILEKPVRVTWSYFQDVKK